MDDNLLVIFIFIFVLILLGLMIGLIILLLPKSNVQLDGSCTHQTECAVGLVCSAAPRTFTGSVCLKGLLQECETNSECSTGLTCVNHLCSLTGSTGTPPLTLISNNLVFNTQPSFSTTLIKNNFMVQKMTPITTLPSTFYSNFNLPSVDKKKLLFR